MSTLFTPKMHASDLADFEAGIITTLSTADFNVTCEDALSRMSRIDSGSIHAIITDPAYQSLEKHRKGGTTCRLSGGKNQDKGNGWFPTIDNEYLFHFMCECYRLLPKNGHAWLLSDGETLGYLWGYFNSGETGFKYAKSYPVLKLAANTPGYRSGTGYHGRASHEYAFLMEKGRRRFPKGWEDAPDVISVVWNGDTETRQVLGKPYPTAKPTELYKGLAARSSEPGEIVLDPFSGGGTVCSLIEEGRFVVANDLTRTGAGATAKRAYHYAQLRV